jgi:thioredoxin 1
MILTDDTLQEAMDRNSRLFLYFWAEWCGPCKRFSPIVSEIKEEKSLNLFKINSDENPKSSEGFNVTGIPTILVIENGSVVDRVTGAMPRHKLIERLKQWI